MRGGERTVQRNECIEKTLRKKEKEQQRNKTREIERERGMEEENSKR